ncbi:hypothetical protein C8035_v003187 [Colletotrichum spinosum]|uniref:Uncharacterized protein n=1 Tax=Colletotrichum spinosum TaxID=1347390 RepID=A0A4R8Q8V1_9PEZI|nr:hypothetical protein C8035_v003187 [Colletotrichum spinosum]
MCEIKISERPVLSRALTCSNDQAKLSDAWFTNNLCLDHQSEAVRFAYYNGDLSPPEELPSTEIKGHERRPRKRRSQQKTRPAASSDPGPLDPDRGFGLRSERHDAALASHRLSATEEVTSRPSFVKPAEDQRDDTPATPRRSQKTVHFADAPRADSPSGPARTAHLSSAPHSRHHRRADGRHGNRPSPRATSSAVARTNNVRERRNATGQVGSDTNGTGDVRRTARTRPNR